MYQIILIFMITIKFHYQLQVIMTKYDFQEYTSQFFVPYKATFLIEIMKIIFSNNNSVYAYKYTKPEIY